MARRAGRRRRLEAFLEERMDDRVDLRVGLLDAGDRRLGELRGLASPSADQRRLRRRVHGGEVGHERILLPHSSPAGRQCGGMERTVGRRGAGNPQRLSPSRVCDSDRVAQHCGLAFLQGGDSLELDRRAAGAFEESDAVADEDWGDVDDDFVEEARLENLPGDGRAQDDHVGAPSRILGDRYRVLDWDVDDWPVTPLTTGGWAGGSWRRTKKGPRRRRRRSPAGAGPQRPAFAGRPVGLPSIARPRRPSARLRHRPRRPNPSRRSAPR